MPQPKQAPQVDWSTAQPISSADVDWNSAQPISTETVPTSEVGGAHLRRVEMGDKPGFFRGLFEGPINTIAHPLQTASGMGMPFVATGMAPGGMYPTTAATGRMSDLEANHAVQMEAQQDQARQANAIADNPSYAAGQFVGNAAVGAALGGGLKFGRTMADPLRAYRSPLIPENEAIARATADILRPNPMEYRSTVQGLMARMPEVKQFFDTAGTKPHSPLEFAKAAQGAGKNKTGFFQENLIAPNAEAPAGSGTVGSVYARLGEINDKLRPIYKARSMGEQLTKEAADNMAELERERDQLNGVLYQTVSERSGLPVEQIKDINQGGAQLQHIGDVSDSAQALRRSGYGGYTSTGIPIPMSGVDRAVQLVKFLRGGPEAVAGRKLARVMSKVKEEPTPLPNAEEIASHRANYQAQAEDAAAENRQASMARKPEGMGPTPRLEPVMQNPNPELLQRSARITERGSGIAQAESDARAAKLAKSLREEELLGPARRLQSIARKSRD